MAQDVMWTLTLERANIVLAVLGKQPLEQVLDLWMDLRQQTIASQQQQPQLQRSNGEARPVLPG